MVKPLLDAGVSAAAIDVFSLESPLCYAGIGTFQPFRLCHDVSNCGWRLFLGSERAIYATDTGSIDHVEAKDYDLMLIEANHKEAELEARLAEKEAAGVYAYERRAAVAHLSEEQALAWLADNAGPHSKYIFLHQHKEENNA